MPIPTLTPAGEDTLQVASMLIAADFLDTATDVLHFFEKPHKYQHEAAAWDQAGRPYPEDPGWELFAARLERQA